MIDETRKQRLSNQKWHLTLSFAHINAIQMGLSQRIEWLGQCVSTFKDNEHFREQLAEARMAQRAVRNAQLRRNNNG